MDVKTLPLNFPFELPLIPHTKYKFKRRLNQVHLQSVKQAGGDWEWNRIVLTIRAVIHLLFVEKGKEPQGNIFGKNKRSFHYTYSINRQVILIL